MENVKIKLNDTNGKLNDEFVKLNAPFVECKLCPADTDVYIVDIQSDSYKTDRKIIVNF